MNGQVMLGMEFQFAYGWMEETASQQKLLTEVKHKKRSRKGKDIYCQNRRILQQGIWEHLNGNQEAFVCNLRLDALCDLRQRI